jgi:hypothetical protein
VRTFRALNDLFSEVTDGEVRVRIEQPEGTRGSLKWIQHLVDRHPASLDESLREAGALSLVNHLTWLSPLRIDNWAEYRDSQFLHKISQAHLSEELTKFWPRRGPQWDALAKDESGRIFLFEAKAYGAEMSSTCAAGATSLRLINTSLESSKLAFCATPGADWISGYYQYANRLAHLHFLQKHGVDARLVFLYFVGDGEMNGPASEAEWKPYIDAAHAHLGISERTHGAVAIFQDVRGKSSER